MRAAFGGELRLEIFVYLLCEAIREEIREERRDAHAAGPSPRSQLPEAVPAIHRPASPAPSPHQFCPYDNTAPRTCSFLSDSSRFCPSFAHSLSSAPNSSPPRRFSCLQLLSPFSTSSSTIRFSRQDSREVVRLVKSAMVDPSVGVEARGEGEGSGGGEGGSSGKTARK